jgi:hypothetical protein
VTSISGKPGDKAPDEATVAPVVTPTWEKYRRQYLKVIRCVSSARSWPLRSAKIVDHIIPIEAVMMFCSGLSGITSRYALHHNQKTTTRPGDQAAA